MTDRPEVAPITERDDDVHEHGGTPGWRERLVFGFADAAAGFGGVCRVNLYPNEAKADATLNVFLPDRSMATVLARGAFDRAIEVGRLRLTPDTPLKAWRLSCVDTALVFHGIGPTGMPTSRERTGSAARIELDLRFEAWMQPAGELERRQIRDEMNFVQVISNGRFEQAGRVTGTIRVGGHQGSIDTGGIRERAWGWGVEREGSESFWLACGFGPARAISIHGATVDQAMRVRGWALIDRAVHPIKAARVERETEGKTVRRVRATATVDGAEVVLTGDVRSTVPVQAGGGRTQQSQVAYDWDGRTSGGLAEFTR